jgi:cytochrome b subunit of formate dehydrogenase
MSETATSIPKLQRRRVTGTYIAANDAAAAARRFISLPNGEQYVIRFSRTQRIEHVFLILTVAALALTGFSQTYYTTRIGNSILALFGGIDSARQVHHLFGLLLGLQVIYHLAVSIRDLFTGPRMSKIWLDANDLVQLFQLLGYNLRLSKGRPRFDRYSVEQKIHYWIFALGIFILAASGLMQLFPTFTAKYLPGWIIPIGRAFHHWQAILTVSILLTWHLYQNMLKGLNRSIFSGLMSVDEMKREHPMELLYLERSVAQINNTKWPRFISLETEDLREPQPAVTKPEPVIDASAEFPAETMPEAAVIAEVLSEKPDADLTESVSGLDASEDVQNG